VIAGVLSLAATAQTPAKKPLRSPSAQVHDREFESKALGRTARYRVVVPGDYDWNHERYPVLYLLHGLNGGYENWETLTNLVHYAEKYRMIIAMPDADDSWYVNSATVPQNRYEDYIIDDFIPDVERNWRVLRSRHRRAIAGLSMGGYGALKFALKNPGLFGFAGSLSGALDAGSESIALRRPDLVDQLNEIFGPAESETRSKNNLLKLAAGLAPPESLYIYLDCGNRDRLLDSNREFAKVLSEKKFRFEYHETPGEHTWEYWDRRLPELLEAVSKQITQP